MCERLGWNTRANREMLAYVHVEGKRSRGHTKGDLDGKEKRKKEKRKSRRGHTKGDLDV